MGSVRDRFDKRLLIIVGVVGLLLLLAAYALGVFAPIRASATVPQASCSFSTGTCTLLVTDSGFSDITLTGGTILIGGQTFSLPQAAFVYSSPIVGGSTVSVSVYCSSAKGFSTMSPVGSQVTGSITVDGAYMASWTAIVTD